MIKRLFKKGKENFLEEQVLAAQNGDEQTRHHLLEKYRPFIAKNVSEVCKRYIDPDRDDEFSIGLMAFNEAIDSFSKEKGSSFLSFAKLVVKRKVIDYLRSEQNQPAAVSLDEEIQDEEQMENPNEVKIARERFAQETDAWHRKEEILEFREKLRAYKISFEELIEISPKHQDARESAMEVARIIYETPSLREYVQEKKRLPMKELINYVSVSKKTLERNRKYILAIFIILSEDYMYLKEYIKGVKV